MSVYKDRIVFVDALIRHNKDRQNLISRCADRDTRCRHDAIPVAKPNLRRTHTEKKSQPPDGHMFSRDDVRLLISSSGVQAGRD